MFYKVDANETVVIFETQKEADIYCNWWTVMRAQTPIDARPEHMTNEFSEYAYYVLSGMISEFEGVIPDASNPEHAEMFERLLSITHLFASDND